MTTFDETYDQIHTRGVVLYLKSADKKVYEDAEMTKQADKETVTELFTKNILVLSDGTNYIAPAKLTATKLIVIDTASSALAFVEYAFKAE